MHKTIFIYQLIQRLCRNLTQGVRYDQVVKMHLSKTTGALLNHIKGLSDPVILRLCRSDKQEKSNTI
ncbi:hypothetical protein BDF21DRAFT_211386 [Thamnidium elegans]|nr:hypothetical protein BDF21DRAFT_211386 [Thamnidium elegans]